MKIKDIIVKNSLITIILDDDSEYILHIDVFSFSNITRTSDVTKSNLIKLVNDSKFYFCKDYLMNQISKYTKTECTKLMWKPNKSL